MTLKMKRVQVRLEDDLLAQLDAVVQDLGTNRSAFVRDVLRTAVRRHQVAIQEAKHAVGYALLPVQPGEFDG